jgi:hypothetical protein
VRLNIATLSAAILVATAIALQVQKANRPPPPVREPPRAAAPTVPPPAQVARGTDETPEVLPEGKGRDEAFYLCTACHGTAIITQQGLSRQRWEETFDWMIEKHRMPDPGAADRALIVDYLASAFPSRQRGRSNPFANR